MAGTTGQTLHYEGGTWTASSNLHHDGTNVGIGTTDPQSKLHVNKDLTIAGGTDRGINNELDITGAQPTGLDQTVYGIQNEINNYVTGSDNDDRFFEVFCFSSIKGKVFYLIYAINTYNCTIYTFITLKF